MTDFCISVAGLTVGVSAIYPSAESFFADYLSGDAPDLSIGIGEEDIAFERVCATRQAAREGAPGRRFGDRYLETLAILRKLADAAVDRDALLFHGCAVALNGRAYLFAAPSGVGKTTHASHWLRLFPQAHILNGDKPFLRVIDGAVFACGTPWRGKERLGVNETLPLKAICFLRRGSGNRIAPLSFREALAPMLRQVRKPAGQDGILKTLRLCEKIAAGVSLYDLECTAGPESAEISSAAMLAQE